MEIKYCPKCQDEMKLVPAGISKKTGKSYNAFWACKQRNCGHTENLDGSAGYTKKAPNVPQNAPQSLTDTSEIVSLLKSIDEHLAKIEYNSLKSDDGTPIPF